MKKQFKSLAALSIWILSLLISGSIAQGQQTVPQEEWGAGFQGFVTIAASRSLTFSKDPADENLDKTTALLVLMGSSGQPVVDIAQWLADGGSVLVAIDQSDSETLRDFGLRFIGGDWRARSSLDAYPNYSDCPLIRTFDRSHPITNGVRTVVSNQPAILARNQGRFSNDVTVIAQFPQLAQRRSGQTFAVVYEHASGGRLLAVADPSIFCNQMLALGGNARFTLQAIEWLREENRTNLFMFIDGQYSTPAGLDQTQIQLPPPTKEEVLEALRNLPADKLIEFGNTVATMVEDEGLVNEFLQTVSQDAPDLLFRQLLITAVTVVIAFCLWFNYFSRDTILESLNPDRSNAGAPITRKQRRELAIQQRLWAARTLLERFLIQVTGEGLRNSEKRISAIHLDSTDRNDASKTRRELKRAIRAIEKRKPAWWKRRRLLRLESRVVNWSQLHAQGILVYDNGINSNYGTSKK